MAMNGYAAMVRARTDKPKSKRRKLDDYETPASVTHRVFTVTKFRGPIADPACGSGRILKVIREHGFKAFGSDIKKGQNYLERTRIWEGDTITNPPYRDGLAEAFCRKALELTTGQVAMLLQNGFLWGDNRASGLFREFKPKYIIVIPERILFYDFGTGKPIKSQFYSHCWVIWPNAAGRKRPVHDTKLYWRSQGDALDSSVEKEFG